MKHHNTLRLTALLLACLLCLSLCSCGAAEKDKSSPDEDGEKTLRVIIDKNDKARRPSELATQGFNQQLDLLLLDFRVKHRDCKVVVEEIPEDKDERERFIKEVNTEILAGKGPDLFLLRSDYVPYGKETFDNHPFFTDVRLLMENGIFYDLSEFYDADTELHTEALRKEIMDAGVIDGARYVLPLRYDIPVVYVNGTKYDELGLDRNILTGNIYDFLSAASDIPDAAQADNFFPGNLANEFFGLFPEIIDYENRTVTLDCTAVEEYATFFRDSMIKIANRQAESENSIPVLGYKPEAYYDAYFFGHHWLDAEGRFMFFDSLSTAFENVSIAKARGIELEMYPLRGIDGSVTAEVSFFGAMSANCKNPELAYEFLRTFLTEEYQWDKVQSSVINTKWMQSAPGWPVRTEGSVEELASSIKSTNPMKNLNNDLYPLELDSLTAEDFPILDVSLDRVCFPIAYIELQCHEKLYSLFEIDKKTGLTQQSDVSPADVVDECIRELQTHLDEG